VGRYADYRAFAEEGEPKEGESGQKSASDVAAPARQREKKGLSYAERKEFDSLLDEISVLEDEKSTLESLFSSSSPKPEDLETGNRRYAEVVSLVEEKTARWETLAALDAS
jgi:ATP-binding cassette subfamily F protein uup